MNVRHDEPEVELEEIPSFLSFRDGFEVDDRKQDEVPYGKDDAGIGYRNESDR